MCCHKDPTKQSLSELQKECGEYWGTKLYHTIHAPVNTPIWIIIFGVIFSTMPIWLPILLTIFCT